MIVYTVQPLHRYHRMRQEGFLEGDQHYAMFPDAYRWMVEQMDKRLPFEEKGIYPIWLWQRVPNRNEKCLAPKGQKWVILKLEVPDEHILWSNFEEWHSILSEMPITKDEKDWYNWLDRDFPLDEVKKTWEKLFDHEWLASREKDWAGDYASQWQQGVTPRITMEQVRKVSRFVGKG